MHSIKLPVAPAFSGNVALADTRPFWKDSLGSPTLQVHHFNRNAGTYYIIGNAAGNAMISLLKSRLKVRKKK